jgi:class 3 adenylate cyclase/tetratricopeptide (TPR) repeat protein
VVSSLCREPESAGVRTHNGTLSVSTPTARTLVAMSNAVRTRLLAVLFVDQVASTSLLQELGDIRADELRRRLEPILDDAILQHEGKIVKKTGDGRMAVFESATQAIDAGIEMHMRCVRDNWANAGSASLNIRVGVSVGDVTEENDDYHGTTVVEAARLESAATESGMLCTDLARSMVGSRSDGKFETRVAVDAKGFTEPIPAWVVTWDVERSLPQRTLPPELGAGGRFDFVGRQRELAEARRAWAGVSAGEITGILVAGEPGVGKTRLARELAIEAIDDGALVLYGRCDEGVGASFQPFANALEHFVERHTPAAGDLGRFAGELRRLVPDLHHRVSDLPGMIEADSGTEQYRLFDAVLSWLETTAGDQPVLLVVDDIHWAAEPTLHLLRHLLRRVPEAPVCILATYRDTEADGSSRLLRFLGETQRFPGTASISLRGLDGSDILALLQAAQLDLSDEASAAMLADRLQNQTAGNAFFLGEVITLLRERGLDGVGVGIPEALGEVVLDRVSRLSPTAVEMLNAISVANTDVSLDVLAIATNRSRSELIEATEEALHAGILIEVPDTPVRFRYQHDLVRSTMYETMSLGRRSQRHHDMAAAIEEVHARDLSEYLDELAYHYDRSTDPADADRAVIVAQLAGDNASNRLGFSTAVEHYENALRLMDRYGATHPDQLRGRLKLSLGVAMKRAGIRGSRAMLFEAAEIAAANDDQATIVSAALANTRGFFSSAGRTDNDRVRLLEMALEAVDPDDSAHTAKLLANLSVELTFGDDHERRQALSDESLAMAERLDDEFCLAHVINQRIGVLWSARGLPERLRLCERLQTITAHLGSPQWQYTAASSQFQAAMESGDLELADRCLAQMGSTLDELRQPLLKAYLLMRESVRAIVGGDLARGEELATECFELGQASGQPDALTFYFGQLVNLRFHQGRMGELEAIIAQESASNPGLPSLQSALALLYCEVGKLDKAREPFEDLADRHHELLHDLSWLVMTTLLADACFQLGDANRAARLHTALEPYRDQCVDNATNWFGSVGHYLALLEHTMGHFVEADASFAAAVQWHTRMPAPALLARTQIDWATSLLDRPEPDTDRADELITASTKVAERLGLGNVSARAEKLLAVR